MIIKRDVIAPDGSALQLGLSKSSTIRQHIHSNSISATWTVGVDSSIYVVIISKFQICGPAGSATIHKTKTRILSEWSSVSAITTIDCLPSLDAP